MAKFDAQHTQDELEKVIIELRHMESILAVEIALSARKNHHIHCERLKAKRRSIQSILIEARSELEYLKNDRPHLRVVS